MNVRISPSIQTSMSFKHTAFVVITGTAAFYLTLLAIAHVTIFYISPPNQKFGTQGAFEIVRTLLLLPTAAHLLTLSIFYGYKGPPIQSYYASLKSSFARSFVHGVLSSTFLAILFSLVLFNCDVPWPIMLVALIPVGYLICHLTFLVRNKALDDVM